ncbi:MAG: hypothetical protein Edafosvirus2_56 [Edafosvirus sp.]|uniref:DUF4116 domain-containing protein n=1 Tax=Edafosvirus sp. TaxID=2487765 RepID=A0A3G4ZSK8_9VIRU|nr:MAG: hypothetical protein Edafosvirus2_56 [Edafosvirus sp.]
MGATTSTEIDGQKFNEKYKDKKFIRLISDDEKIDHTQNYVESLTGIYFYKNTRIGEWITTDSGVITKYQDVEIPNDARVQILKKNRFMSDRVNVGEMKNIADSPLWRTSQKLRVRAVEHKHENIKYVTNHEHIIYLLKKFPCALRFVVNQTDAMCIAAVKRDGNALRFVTTQTEEICTHAVRQNPYALQYVLKQTEEICSVAIAYRPEAIFHINNDKLPDYLDKNEFMKRMQMLSIDSARAEL